MKKPKMKKFDPLYDWNECVEYIEHLTGKDIRDWAGHFKAQAEARQKAHDLHGDESWYSEVPEDFTAKQKEQCDLYDKLNDKNILPPYQDFWHEICDDVHNGSYLWLSDNRWKNGWQKEIADLIFKEFGDGKHEIRFWVEW